MDDKSLHCSQISCVQLLLSVCTKSISGPLKGYFVLYKTRVTMVPDKGNYGAYHVGFLRTVEQHDT